MLSYYRRSISLAFIILMYIVPASKAFLVAIEQPKGRRKNNDSHRIQSYYRDKKVTSTAVCSRVITTSNKLVKAGDLLCDIATPALLIELSLAETAATATSGEGVITLNKVLEDPQLFVTDDGTSILDGSLFIHTTVTSTAKRDAIEKEYGSGKSLVICEVDATTQHTHSDCKDNKDVDYGGAYLGLGLANHHVGGYYWARGMGMGASLPAHGVSFRDCVNESNNSDQLCSGELYWKKRGPGEDPTETTEESSNSNDGKRSEWADFLAVGDTVQLVPEDPMSLLTSSASPFKTLIGMRRIGRPLGADPIVEKLWTRRDSDISEEFNGRKNGWIAI